MSGSPSEPAGRPGRAQLVLGVLGAALLFISFWWPGTWTGPDAPHAGGAAVSILIADISWPLLWLAGAVGYGWALRTWLLPAARDTLAIEIGLGVATLLTLDALLGRIGALTAGGGVGAWALVAGGILLVVLRFRRGDEEDEEDNASGIADPRETAGRQLLWCVAPAAALLLLAACSAPGWLWATEHGGYDVLSYHLQLPKEWRALGRVQGLDHNVYSSFPSYVESAYLHLAVLRRGEPLYASQLLHAALAVLTATVVFRLGRRAAGGPAIGALAAGLALGTPWVIVVGSLAYDEMAVTLMLATGLLALEDEADAVPWRLGAAVGLLAGAACGAKLTSAGLVALPLAALLLFIGGPWRRRAAAAGACAIAALAALAPWLIANAIERGNPVFPFATSILGTGHWTADQAAIWAAGHGGAGGLGDRLVAAWNEVLRFGLGPAPPDAIAWRPQWSVLPWLALLGAIAALTARGQRGRVARLVLVIALQAAFWLALTHVKSRFMVPAVVPAALLAALGVAALANRLGTPLLRRLGAGAAAAALLAYCLVPTALFRTEQGGLPAAAVGAEGLFAGDAHAAALKRPGLTDAERQAVLADLPAAFWFNHALAADDRVLSVGDGAPLYYLRGNFEYQTTWDRGPMSRVMREHPDDPAAWIRGLRDAGYTHLWVNREMLSIWEAEGWNDPLITPARVIHAAETHAAVLYRRGPFALYLLPG